MPAGVGLRETQSPAGGSKAGPNSSVVKTHEIFLIAASSHGSAALENPTLAVITTHSIIWPSESTG